MTHDHNHPLVKQAAALVVPEAIRQACLDRPLGGVLLSRIYAVRASWEAKELAKAKGMSVAASEAELASALQSTDVSDILLLESPGLSLEQLSTRLAVIGKAKTIYFQQAQGGV